YGTEGVAGRPAEPAGAAVAAAPGATAGSSSAWLKPSRSANRPSGPGAHQFHLPISRIVAGTSRTRTIVASMRTAIAMPTPIDLIVIDSARAKAENTVTMISAAPVM